MSRFDPFDLYSHRQGHSHNGQILRKKPVKPSYAISNEMVKDAKRVLESVGLYSSNHFIPKFFSNVYTMNSGQLQFPAIDNVLSVSFQNLWDIIYDQFLPLLRVDPTSVSNLIFSIDIISINLFRNYNLPNANGSYTDIRFYFFDPAQTLDITGSGYGDLTFYNSFYGLFSLQAFDNANLIATYEIRSFDGSYISVNSIGISLIRILSSLKRTCNCITMTTSISTRHKKK